MYYIFYIVLYIIYYIQCVLPPGFNWASATPQLSLFSMEPTWTPTKWVKAVESLYNKNNFFLILLSKRCDRYPFLLHKYEFLTIFLKSARRQYPRFETFGKKSNALMDLKHITFSTKIFLRASWPRGSFFLEKLDCSLVQYWNHNHDNISFQWWLFTKEVCSGAIQMWFLPSFETGCFCTEKSYIKPLWELTN